MPDRPIYERRKREVLGLLRSLAESVSAIKKQIDSMAVDANASKKQQRPNPPESIRVEALLSPAITKYYETRQHRTPRREWWKWSNVVLQTLTLAALLWYACTTYKMWLSMDTQTEISERPWIVRANPEMIDYPQSDGKMDAFGFNDSNDTYAVVKMNVSNVGKSPAVNVVVVAELYFPQYPTTAMPIENRPKSLKEEQASFCGNIVTGTSQDALFMGSPALLIKRTIGASRNAVLKSNKKVFESQGREGFLVPVIVVCVAYSPIYNLNAPYHTGLSYVLSRSDGLALKFGERVPASLLKLEPSSVGPFIQ